MRLFLLAACALLAGACASAQPVGAPASAVAARVADTATPASAAATRLLVADTLSRAPDDWWLRDAETDGIRGIGAERAHRELLAGRTPARQVVVAVIDSGVDTAHADLRPHLWANPDEIPGTGRDDDGNGYVDDVRGWSFIGGADGRNVHHDTFEVTRLYAELRPTFQGARSDTLSGAAREEFERYRLVRTEFESERAEANRQLRQLREIEVAVEQVTRLLLMHLGTDSLRIEDVREIRTTRSDVRQARGIFLQLAAEDITPAAITRQREHVEGRVQYGFNPSFDPRAIVGDDYSNPDERFYGSTDVVGPDAVHGTHVAGIIAAGGRPSPMTGETGGVRLMAIRAVPNGDERDKDVANAIRYAVDNGAHIINMSFGKGHSPHKAVVDEAVRYAESRGVLLVHAAGNSGADLGTEANFPNRQYADGGSAELWLEVGASAWWAADSLAAPFSNYGREHVDLFAPGIDIRSTVPGDLYDRNSGTSMAAPVVSGVAALLMTYFPELSAGEVREILLESASRHPGRQVRRPGDDRGTIDFCELSRSCGIVNAYEAVRLAAERSAARPAAALVEN